MLKSKQVNKGEKKIKHELFLAKCKLIKENKQKAYKEYKQKSFKEKHISIEIDRSVPKPAPAVIKTWDPLEVLPEVCVNFLCCKENVHTKAWEFKQPACICNSILQILEKCTTSFFSTT